MAKSTAFQTLADMLQAGGAHPQLHPERLAPSATYDVLYRMSIIAAAFQIHATQVVGYKRRINAGRLKLLQFVAFRPWLLPVIRKWSESQGYAQESVFTPREMQRGFLSDVIHEKVIDFMIARGLFLRMNTQLATGDNAALLSRLEQTRSENSLFQTSVRTLHELKDISITNHMLEGW